MLHRIAFTSLLLAMFLSPAQASASGPGNTTHPSATTSFTFADLGEKDMLIKTIFEQDSIHFPLAEGRQISHAVLRLHSSHSKKLLASMSDLTIALNNEPLANIILAPENADEMTMDIDLPVESLRSGDNVILFRSNIRLKDNGCADVGDSDLWLQIFADSSILLDESDLPAAPDLARFPAPFETLSTLPGSPQLTIVLPSRPTAAELTAAAQISAALGQSAKWENPPLSAYTYDQLDQARALADELIVITTGSRNPLASSAAPGLTEAVSPYNAGRLMLVVSGADDTALLQSAALLSTQSAHAQLSGTQVAPREVAVPNSGQRKSPETFDQLGFETQRVRGIGAHDLYYPIDIPYDWKTTSDASLELHFSHAHGMSVASLMTAFINGFEITNLRLDSRNADDGRLVIQLSPRQIHPGRNWLHLFFDLHIRRENCNYRYREEVWAEISADKSLANLAHVASESPLELGYLPSSLVTPPDLSENIFVLPALPSSADLTAMVRLSAKLGTYSDADGVRPQAATDATFSQERLKKADVILIGSPGTNTSIQQYDAQLPQPLKLVNGLVVAATGRDLLPEEQAGQVGYIEVLPAPWEQRSSLFVFSSQSPALMERTVDVFPTLGHRWKSQGNVAVVGVDHVTVLSLGALAGVTLSTPARLILAGILIGVFIVLVIAGLIIGRLYRTRQKEAEDEI